MFTDNASEKDTERSELEALFAFTREGDTIVVRSMDRLARNLDSRRRLVEDWTKVRIRVELVKEGLTFTGDDSPMATLLLSIMRAFAEFERSLLRKRRLCPSQTASSKSKAWRKKSTSGT